MCCSPDSTSVKSASLLPITNATGHLLNATEVDHDKLTGVLSVSSYHDLNSTFYI